MADLQTLNIKIDHDQRLAALHRFITVHFDNTPYSIKPLAGDASFRRYFRIQFPNKTLIAMDAPPDKEDCLPFVTIAEIFQRQNLQVPEIITKDLNQGFLLITDFGDDVYFRVLNSTNADALYQRAMNELTLIQTCQQNKGYVFPNFLPLIQEELKRFYEWYLKQHLQLVLTTEEETLLADTFIALSDLAASQPQVCVHRDYHSRNLLVMPEKNVGILDFQDAVWGPVTYDLVSLIRDCYIDWPQQQVLQWANDYRQLILEKKIIAEKSQALFMHWFDWMGIQRHLKAIYIFARKYHRDGNANYLADIPRALKYILSTTENYPELQRFRKFLLRVLP